MVMSGKQYEGYRHFHELAILVGTRGVSILKGVDKMLVKPDFLARAFYMIDVHLPEIAFLSEGQADSAVRMDHLFFPVVKKGGDSQVIVIPCSEGNPCRMRHIGPGICGAAVIFLIVCQFKAGVGYVFDIEIEVFGLAVNLQAKIPFLDKFRLNQLLVDKPQLVEIFRFAVHGAAGPAAQNPAKALVEQ